MRGSGRPAADQPAVRDPRRRRRRDALTPAASCRSTRRRAVVTPKMQRRLVHDALAAAAGGPARSAARRASAQRLGLPSRLRGAARRALSAGRTRRSTTLNAFATPAQRRLIFEEAFLFQMGVLARRRARGGGAQAAPVAVDDRIRESARRVLPFKLTGGQKQALKEIVDDMQRPQPMNRLLQGDVGAGKTIVALLAALVAMENGLQVAFMAPTEILAEQHFLNISRLLAAVALSRGAADRRHGARPRGASSSRELAAGAIHLVVGTHALVQGDVAFKRARARRHRRAAPLRRAAARDAARQGAASRRARDDRDADSAHAGADGLRRSRRLGDSRAAAGPAADQDDGASRSRGATRSTRSSASSSTPGRQAYVIYPLVEESEKVDLQGGDRDGRPPRAGGVSRHTASALLHGRHEAGREGSRDEGVRARRAADARLDDGRRGRRRRAERDA